GDGKIDLAAESNGTDNIGILIGNGDGTFQAAVMYATGGTSSGSMVVGDFNRDGKLDLATSNFNSNNVSILLGNGDGTFQGAVNYAVGSQPAAPTVADLNRDGKPDLVVPNSAGSTVTVLLNNASATVCTFQAPSNYTTGTTPAGAVTGDFNRDGIPD